MEDYEDIDANLKYSSLSRWFLTSLASASTPSACDPEIATTLATEPCQAYAIAELLNIFDSNFFNQEDFLSSIQKDDYKSDYRIKIINLSRVISYILSYYKNVLGKSFTDEFSNSSLILPEHGKFIIEDESDVQHRAMLLQLILGIAVNQPEQVTLIMGLEPEDQGIVAACINHLMAGQIDKSEISPEDQLDQEHDPYNLQHDQNLPSEDQDLSTHENLGENFGEISNKNSEQDPSQSHSHSRSLGNLREEMGSANNQLQHVNHIETVLNKSMQSVNSRHSSGNNLNSYGSAGNNLNSNDRNIPSRNNKSSSPRDNNLLNSNLNLQKIHDLQNTLQQVTEHKHQLEAENEQLQERLQALTNNEFFQAESDQYQQKLKSMQEKLHEVSDENYRLELLKDEYAAKVSSLSSEIQTLTEEAKEKDMMFDDVAMLQDELDYLRTEAERAATLEATLESTKRKIADYDSLKTKIKQQNLQIISFEEKLKLNKTDLSRSSNDREQLAILKAENRNLTQKITDEKNKREKFAFENKNLKENVKSLSSENTRLKHDLENFAGAGGGLRSNSEEGESLGALGESLGENLSSPAHATHSGADQAQLQLANERIQELEEKYEDLLQKQAEYSANEAKLDQQNNESKELNNKIQQLEIRLEYLNKQNTDMTTQLEESSKSQTETQTTLEKKEALLAQKEQDMKAMEKRYKAYLEKARSIIRTLDNNKKSASESANTANIHTITKLRAELASKAKIIQRLESEHQKNRENRSDEERLIVNAWHRLTQNNQFKTVQNSVNHKQNLNPTRSNGSFQSGNSGQHVNQPLGSASNLQINAMANNNSNSNAANSNINNNNNNKVQNLNNLTVTTPKRESLNGQSFLSKQRQTANKRFSPKYNSADFSQNMVNQGGLSPGNSQNLGPNGQKGKSWLMGSWTYF